MVALSVWAAVDVLRMILAVGRYEDRIVVVTHGNPDVGPAWWAYEIADVLLPAGVAVPVVADRVWLLATVVAAVTFLGWWQRTRRANWGGLAALLVAVALHLLARLYDALTSPGAAAWGTGWDTRLVAYPLWVAGTVAVVVTASLCVRLIRRVAEDRHASADARGGTAPE
ncbi:hypothetical protein Vqi01_53070 [Micromonospora qiuiae]|uniref:Uncharacterized protein n=1 Tax=Micromonospora qiuiae TaxID=502268 RepID=A0ABQ4JHQ1_9ACTN|nr:hypothetical protein Vqi01_53070 [Micromonospora qiuiae]